MFSVNQQSSYREIVYKITKAMPLQVFLIFKKVCFLLPVLFKLTDSYDTKIYQTLTNPSLFQGEIASFCVFTNVLSQ